MRIYDYVDYKRFTIDLLEAMPNRGRGQFTKFAEIAQTHKATISQVFRGDHHLFPEQALRIAMHLGLSANHARYYVLLVNHARAGSADLRTLYEAEIVREREANRELAERLPKERALTGEERAIFYSNWMYSAVRLLSSIPGFRTSTRIAERLGLSREAVERVLEFLVSSGLCRETESEIGMGPRSTYLESRSPLVARHHGNWRVKAMEKHPVLDAANEIAYTAPVTLSKADALRIREILARTIERADAIVGPSACEKLYCLNIDWFEI
jgi:hypothetical protein